jgi:hypothetical protein
MPEMGSIASCWGLPLEEGGPDDSTDVKMGSVDDLGMIPGSEYVARTKEYKNETARITSMTRGAGVWYPMETGTLWGHDGKGVGIHVSEEDGDREQKQQPYVQSCFHVRANDKPTSDPDISKQSRHVSHSLR